jgi:3-hydroxyisobutyrate dehydrogenase-like beta-hydroxyacid dehydrogenase
VIDPTPVSKDSLIGFIGLGRMGSNFAKRLVEAGWRLVVFDIDPQKRLALADRGCVAAEGASQVIRETDILFTSLPSSKAFETVAGESILPLARAGQVIVDLGTTRLEPTRQTAAALAGKGAALLDAPVSGNPRTPLYIFVGGETVAFERAKPALQVLAHPDHLTHAGLSGAGQILKGVNQLSMGVVQAAWLEAISYATRQGIDAKTVEQAVGGDRGWRADLARAAQQVADGRGEGQDLKFAELPYFLEAAKQAGIEMPLTQTLFEFCDPGPRDWRDNMDRPYASFWHMLNHTESAEQ